MVVQTNHSLASTSFLQRATSASAAFLIVLAALSIFQLSQQQVAHRKTSQRESQLFWFQLPKPVVKLTPPQKPSPTATTTQLSKKRDHIAITTTTPPARTETVEAIPQTESKSDFDDAFKTPNPLPNNIGKYTGMDDSKRRQAYLDSKSELEKRAEKSGKPLADPRLTQQEKFQQAANRAAKPDCLRQGGSILSLFVVAYQVATDHCK